MKEESFEIDGRGKVWADDGVPVKGSGIKEPRGIAWFTTRETAPKTSSKGAWHEDPPKTALPASESVSRDAPSGMTTRKKCIILIQVTLFLIAVVLGARAGLNHAKGNDGSDTATNSVTLEDCLAQLRGGGEYAEYDTPGPSYAPADDIVGPDEYYEEEETPSAKSGKVPDKLERESAGGSAKAGKGTPSDDGSVRRDLRRNSARNADGHLADASSKRRKLESDECDELLAANDTDERDGSRSSKTAKTSKTGRSSKTGKSSDGRDGGSDGERDEEGADTPVPSPGPTAMPDEWVYDVHDGTLPPTAPLSSPAPHVDILDEP